MRLGTENVVVKIINYEALAREREWLEEQAFSHDLVILDEAQRIKNSSTQQHRAAKALNATRRWALTGTPLETRIDDIISIFSFLKPGLLRVATESSVRETIGGQKYMLRRRTEQVLKELPEKIDHEVPIELEGAQRAAYEKMERDKKMELNALGDTVTVQHVFQVISRLRQICNFDPASGQSAKLDRLCDDLEEIESSRQKALIFSQFVKEEMGGIRKIRAVLEEKGIESLPFHGEVSPAQREAHIQRFRDDPVVRALVMNYQTGSVGLNLQQANYVFLFDRWWNPAVEDQAVARAHRLGQSNKVFVTRFYCVGTIEERIMLKLKERRRLFASVVDEGELVAESMGLSEEEIFSLFDLRVRPRRKGEVDPSRIRIVLENMDPTQFEELVARTYERRGYSVAHVGGSHDGGIDVVAEKRSDSGREKIVVQCKRQRSKVDVATVRELWGVVNNDPSITLGVLATSCEFTADAQQFAKGKRLHLIDGTGMRELATRSGVATFGE